MFARALSKMEYVIEPLKTILDLGCGSGFLGLYLLSKNRQIGRGLFVDIDYMACKSTEHNAAVNNLSDRCLILQTDAYSSLRHSIADLVLCAPPYVPYPPSRVGISNGSYAGTGLLTKALSEARLYTKELLLIHSSLANPEVENNVDPRAQSQLLASRKCPFRVPKVIGDKGWTDFLLRDRGLIHLRNSEYKYWHTLYLRKIIFNGY